MRPALYLIISGFCVLHPAWMKAQPRQVEQQSLIWFGFFHTHQFSGPWLIRSDIQERKYTSPSAQHQFLVRSQIFRKWENGWDLGGGLCWFFQNNQDPLAAERLTIPELRPSIEANFIPRQNGIQLSHRYRMEGRFFHNTDGPGTQLAPGYTFGNLRFRYRLEMTVPVFRVKKSLPCKLRVSDEMLLQFADEGLISYFDQNRIALSLQIPVSNVWSVEMGYLNWFQQRKTARQYYNRDIIRLSVIHQTKTRPEAK